MRKAYIRRWYDRSSRKQSESCWRFTPQEHEGEAPSPHYWFHFNFYAPFLLSGLYSITNRTSPFHGFNVSITIHCGFSAVTSSLIDLCWYVATCPRERLQEVRFNEDQSRSDESEQNRGETAKIRPPSSLLLLPNSLRLFSTVLLESQKMRSLRNISLQKFHCCNLN